jgi:hypothetical protein
MHVDDTFHYWTGKYLLANIGIIHKYDHTYTAYTFLAIPLLHACDHTQASYIVILYTPTSKRPISPAPTQNSYDRVYVVLHFAFLQPSAHTTRGVYSTSCSVILIRSRVHGMGSEGFRRT